MVQAAAPHLHQDVAGARRRHRDIPVLEPLQAQPLVDAHLLLPRLVVVYQVVGKVIAAGGELDCFHDAIALSGLVLTAEARY
ncbi:MAG: hypothetical protein IIB11_03355 [Chloroflexi bacterium]|nr:hypothetical protein [Chloroflexota bacterium]